MRNLIGCKIDPLQVPVIIFSKNMFVDPVYPCNTLNCVCKDIFEYYCAIRTLVRQIVSCAYVVKEVRLVEV